LNKRNLLQYGYIKLKAFSRNKTSLTRKVIIMIHSGILARLPEAKVLEEPSSAAALLDNSFMSQFETIDPNDLHFQQDIDYWLTQPQDKAFYQDDSPQDLHNGVELNAGAQHDMNSEQSPAAVFQYQATPSPIIGIGNNSPIQQTPRLEHNQDVWNEVQDFQNSNNGMYCTNFNENSRSLSSNKLYQNMVNSKHDCQDLSHKIDFNLDFQLPSFERPADMEISHMDFQGLFNGIDFNQHFQLPDFEETLNQDILNDVSKLGAINRGSVHHTKELQRVVISPSLTWAGLIPLDQVAPIGAGNDSLYPPLDSQSGSVDPALRWSDPAPKIEQAPFVLESLRQAAYPPHNLSNHVPPNRKRLNDDYILLPPSKRKRGNGTTYKRRANIENMDPSQFYEKLLEIPRSWKPHPDSTVTFQYNEYGNLCTDDRFSANQILEYIYYHPLHKQENGGLTLWVQTVPADASKRYPDKNSDKCRFADCPIQGGSIRKGFFRVAFDEHFRSGRMVDPYHCAGFVHLFCLEKFCDFVQICQHFKVQPDQRQFAEGTNKMAITRDHREMAEVVRAFMRTTQKPDPWEYEQSLNFKLTSKHIELQPKTRQITRAERGGNHIELHKGDLDRFVAGEILKKGQRKRKARDAPKNEKRKRDALEGALVDALKKEKGAISLKSGVKEDERPRKRIVCGFR
jgi:hypothetical protein